MRALRVPSDFMEAEGLVELGFEAGVLADAYAQAAVEEDGRADDFQLALVLGEVLHRRSRGLRGPHPPRH